MEIRRKKIGKAKISQSEHKAEKSCNFFGEGMLLTVLKNIFGNNISEKEIEEISEHEGNIGQALREISIEVSRVDYQYAEDAYELGERYIEFGDLEKAISCYQKVFLVPYNDITVETFYALGFVYIDTRDSHEALKQFYHLRRVGRFDYAYSLLDEIKRVFGKDVTRE